MIVLVDKQEALNINSEYFAMGMKILRQGRVIRLLPDNLPHGVEYKVTDGEFIEPTDLRGMHDIYFMDGFKVGTETAYFGAIVDDMLMLDFDKPPRV